MVEVGLIGSIGGLINRTTHSSLVTSCARHTITFVHSSGAHRRQLSLLRYFRSITKRTWQAGSLFGLRGGPSRPGLPLHTTILMHKTTHRNSCCKKGTPHCSCCPMHVVVVVEPCPIRSGPQYPAMHILIVACHARGANRKKFEKSHCKRVKVACVMSMASAPVQA